jgi:hypothetical protein
MDGLVGVDAPPPLQPASIMASSRAVPSDVRARDEAIIETTSEKR